MNIDTALIQWATETQANYIKAVNEHGSYRKAAAALSINVRTIERGIAAVRNKAALSGYSPEHDYTRPVPTPYNVRGVSTYYDGEGNVRGQWVKSQVDKDKAREAVEEYVSWLVRDAKGKSRIVPPPKNTTDELLAVYPMGDPHFGMYAWAEEAGTDFDLDIAERITKAAIDRLVATAPRTKHALILELGDFFHADDNSARTPRSGNVLDVDTRWAKVMQVGLRAMTYVIYRTLDKHEHVTVRIVKGNHDPHSSFALALALDAFFANNERVTIDLSSAPFWYYQFGKTLIGCTHGDGLKMDALPGIMAADVPREWGDTEHRYWYIGHVHHSQIKEYPGAIVESFRTLASSDAWHSASGYRSGRDMRLLVLHNRFGEVERHTCGIGMIEEGK